MRARFLDGETLGPRRKSKRVFEPKELGWRSAPLGASDPQRALMGVSSLTWPAPKRAGHFLGIHAGRDRNGTRNYSRSDPPRPSRPTTTHFERMTWPIECNST